MPRSIQPEILDSLSPQHPEALHNRRDLRVINRLMGNHRWIERTLAAHAPAAARALEIGAGEGDLCHRLNRRGARVAGLDLWPRPAGWPAARSWHQADIRSFAGYADYDVIFGNLIFHQFTDDELAALGTELRRSARLIIACEPLRRRLSQTSYRVIGRLFGANHVSLHDGHVSIDAGFVGTELPDTLGLTAPEWDVRCSATVRGAYHLIAVRRLP
jgi:hypothetical protein